MFMRVHFIRILPLAYDFINIITLLSALGTETLHTTHTKRQ